MSISPELAQRLIAYRRNPALFVKEVIGAEPEDYQVEVMDAVAGKPRSKVAWRAGRGSGKTTTSAWLVLWHTLLFYESQTVTTASNWRQVAKMLWPEVHKWYSRIDFTKLGFDSSSIDPQKLGIYLSKYWFAVGESSNDPEKLEGFHAEHILFIVDEAKLVTRATFNSIAGCLTTKYAKILVVSTPPRHPHACYFRDIFEKKIPGYELFHTSGLDSPRVDREYIDSITDPVEYKTQVLGEFVDSSGDVLYVFDPQKLEEAIGLELPDVDPIIMGVDIARLGGDKNVVMVRTGKTIGTRIESWSNTLLSYTEGRIKDIARQVMPDIINIDGIGYGAGIYDNMLLEGEFNVENINFKRTPPDRRFANTRAYAYAQLARRIVTGDRSIPDNPDLLLELTAQTYDFDRQGRKLMDPKPLIRKKLGRSPDYADAAVLCSLEGDYDEGAGGGYIF